MRAFVILSFVAVASAGRLGYDYQQGVSGSSAGPVFSAGLGSSGSSGSLNYGAAPNSGVQYTGSSSSSGPVLVDGGLNKEFYQYSAPEEEFDDGAASQRALSAVKRNLRVVFIKAPENNGLANAALQLAKQGAEDKTAIYVLSKQADISDLANQVQQLSQSANHKPEVRFVKYRTQEDAINAQRTIQQQYDALGGTSHSSNEGLAPVLNYASAPQHSGHSTGSGSDLGGVGSSSNIGQIGLAGGSAAREYLPSNFY